MRPSPERAPRNVHELPSSVDELEPADSSLSSTSSATALAALEYSSTNGGGLRRVDRRERKHESEAGKDVECEDETLALGASIVEDESERITIVERERKRKK